MIESQRVEQDWVQSAGVIPQESPGERSPGDPWEPCSGRQIGPAAQGIATQSDEPDQTQHATGQKANGFAEPAALRSTERAHAMDLGDTRLVRQLQLRLSGRQPTGDGDVPMSHALTELADRVRRLHRLGKAYAAVRVSQDVAGLRAVSVPGRTRGHLSPRMS